MTGIKKTRPLPKVINCSDSEENTKKIHKSTGSVKTGAMHRNIHHLASTTTALQGTTALIHYTEKFQLRRKGNNR